MWSRSRTLAQRSRNAGGLRAAGPARARDYLEQGMSTFGGSEAARPATRGRGGEGGPVVAAGVPGERHHQQAGPAHPAASRASMHHGAQPAVLLAATSTGPAAAADGGLPGQGGGQGPGRRGLTRDGDHRRPAAPPGRRLPGDVGRHRPPPGFIGGFRLRAQDFGGSLYLFLRPALVLIRFSVGLQLTEQAHSTKGLQEHAQRGCRPRPRSPLRTARAQPPHRRPSST